MISPIKPKPMLLERARERLERAVAELEAQAQEALGVDPQLAESLDAAQAENSALKEVNEAVSGDLANEIGKAIEADTAVSIVL